MFLKCHISEQQSRSSRFNAYTLQTGIMPLRLVGLGEFYCDENYFTHREGLEQCLFIATLEGRGLLRYRDTEAILAPGTAVVFDCREMQYYATLEGAKGWHFLWAHFTGPSAADLTNLLNCGGLRLVPYAAEEARRLFEELWKLSESPRPAWEVRISALLHTLLADLTDASDPAPETRHFRNLEEAAACIRAKHAMPLRVEDLASQCGLSKYHFIRLFREMFGQPPYEYLTAYRISQAKRLLAETSLSVEEIARQVGYEDSKGLIANFRTRANCTPLQFRRQNRAP